MRTLHGALGGNRAARMHSSLDVAAVLESRISAAGGLTAFCRQNGLSASAVSMARHAHRDYPEGLRRLSGSAGSSVSSRSTKSNSP